MHPTSTTAAQSRNRRRGAHVEGSVGEGVVIGGK